MRLEVKEIPPAKPIKDFVLTLSEREARALYALCGRIGGSPSGPRGFTSAAYEELGQALGLCYGIDMGVYYDIADVVACPKWPKETE